MQSLIAPLCGALIALTSQAPLAKPSAPRPLAKLEPAQGCLLGAFIDLDPMLPTKARDEAGRAHKLPEEFESVVGKSHAIYSYYHGYGKPLPMTWVRRLSQAGKYVHFALEPSEQIGITGGDG